MSKPTFIRIAVVMTLLFMAGFVWIRAAATPDLAAWPTDRTDLLDRAVFVPSGEYDVGSREPMTYPPAKVRLSGFYIWPVEVPPSWWRQQPGEIPAASLTYDEAVAFCGLLSETFALTIRLPTIDEWQVAARAGTPGVLFPWGWAPPAGRSAFDTSNVLPSASYPANPWGLFDMAGNLAEWCQAEVSSATAPVLGGSWAERSPAFLRISHRLALPKSYRDADVGFRFVIEPPPPPL
jgi:formylglycine-generating enzyme required for sulfatase activity